MTVFSSAFLKSRLRKGGRFSLKQPVPSIGDINSTREEVKEFYESWRSFEWKDKDANEGSDSPMEKRHIKNKNRSERESRKKEDNTQQRNIVETAYEAI
ncbi:DnaJ subfamily C member 2 [Puccinia graminis f. sp. tritici CRL 75-36-700-3]|uniref:DnaJ subfamily C member 2 n=1 Tax=Puccinia graminis f. sp. tritici (strain CRL 75-36-700-3 / race SCCL) TaxID=418459 RepID=E3K2I9_PUCGT|nr:DnaJ subfamily C member 2 [Puccinia graminis f. sp. tritici CRL 75-36-700-3]EFP78558.1 DnaJ subfamily C member 2 [Puccinia graminis f. sp. tritici CRL 75-36-700-3]